MNIKAIIEFLDNYLSRTGRRGIDPVEANALLARAGLLPDSEDRPGLPLRKKLRDGLIPHAYQSGGKGSNWTIPHSNTRTQIHSNYQTEKLSLSKVEKNIPKENSTETTDVSKLKKKLEIARLKYKPTIVKYLLIAEAPPDSLERFFYFENVHEHDYLFLGVAKALYPEQKDKYLASRRNSEIKKSILKKLQSEGFYLLDLSELPLSFLAETLNSQIPSLINKIREVVNSETKVILIKASVYDTAFQSLKLAGIKNLVDSRIPFPGQGGQKLFQIEFVKALEKSGYLQNE